MGAALFVRSWAVFGVEPFGEVTEQYSQQVGELGSLLGGESGESGESGVLVAEEVRDGAFGELTPGDSVAGLERLAQQFPVLGLSNASRTVLLRRHQRTCRAALAQALSSEAVLAYKPAPEVYQLAIDTAGCPPERALMVAAHAWDLREAQARGVRTGYVQRPVGDPPTSSDVFDWRFNGLDELVTALTAR